LDKNFNTVYKTDISPQTVIFDDSLTSSVDNIDGDVNYPQFDQAVGGIQATSKSITLRFSNIDTSQSYIRVNVAYQISANQVILAHQVASLLPISGSTLDWTYTGLSVSNGDTVIDYTSMLIPLTSYESSYVMEQVQGRLLRANLKGKNRDYSQLQTFVNSNLTLKWIAEESRTELLNELDWMYAQVIAKWQKLKNVDFVEEISGLLKSGDDETEEFDENGELIVKGKKYSKKKIGLNEQHQAKYVDLALKIIEMKAKMTGAMAIEKHEISIVDLLKGKVLDDGGKAKGVKITSEEDLTRMYADPQFSFEEIQIVPDEFRDEEE